MAPAVETCYFLFLFPTIPHMCMFTHLHVSNYNHHVQTSNSGKSSGTNSGKRMSTHPFWEREMALDVFIQFTSCLVGNHHRVVGAVLAMWNMRLWNCLSCFVILWHCYAVLTCVCYWHTSSWWWVFVRVCSLMLNLSCLCNVYILMEAGSRYPIMCRFCWMSLGPPRLLLHSGSRQMEQSLIVMQSYSHRLHLWLVLPQMHPCRDRFLSCTVWNKLYHVFN